MKKLYDTSENNFLKFNEVVPYYSNDWKIQSPKLATMLLELGPQIEAMSKIIFEELKLKHEKKKKNSRHYFHDYYLKINSKGLLRNQEIMLKEMQKSLMPFENRKNEFTWWQAYVKVKHEMPEGLTFSTLNYTIQSLGALSILHHVAHIIKIGNLAKLSPNEIIDYSYWHDSTQEGIDADQETPIGGSNFDSDWWTSKLFYFPSRRFDLL